MSIKRTTAPVGHPGGPIVTRGRTDLSSIKCPIGGCEGYATPTGTLKGKTTYRCNKCQRESNASKF